MLGTLAPTHGFLSRPAFTGPYWPMTRHVASRVTSPLHLGPHSLITAHAFDHFIHVPSFQAGPRPRPDSDGPDSMITSPIRRGLRARPGLGRTECSRARPAAPHGSCHGQRDPKHQHHRASPGACKPHGHARTAFVDLLAQQPAGAGHFDRGARSTGGKPLADSGTSHRDATSPAQVGRVYPKPPRCSPSGDANGVRLP